MSNIEWNAAQLDAIESRGENILLSAAAGSGKTATLTERIIRLICAGEADITRVLAVTFTNDAAGELKARIGAALSEVLAAEPENRAVARQLQALEGAAVSTVHSFLLGELRPYFMRFSLPSDFGVADEADIIGQKGEIMLDTVNDFFDGVCECGDFGLAADSLAGARNGESLDKALLSVYDSLKRLGRGTDFLVQTKTGEDFWDSGAGTYIKKKLNIVKEYYIHAFRELAKGLAANPDTAGYAAGADATLKLLEGLTDSSYSAAASSLKAIDLPRLASLKAELQTDEYAAYKEARAGLKAEIKELNNSFFSAGEERLLFAGETNSRVCRAIAAVLDEFERRFTAAKRERGTVDFNDIEEMAVSLFCRRVNGQVVPTGEALEAAERFDYIFIDEYQDTNLQQDMIFTALSGGLQRFTVGDVKQSIYGFRGARPEVLLELRRSYERGEGGRAIFMSENHRSTAPVLDFANTVSAYMFSAGGTPFEEQDRLVCARQSEGASPVELCLVEASEEINSEARYVAQRIYRFIHEDGCDAGDIAVLTRSSGAVADYKRELERLGVPVRNNSAESFFDYPEVQLIFSLMNAVDNPLRDVHLAGVMKSPLFGFTMDELVRLRGGEKAPLWHSVNKYAASNEDETAQKLQGFIRHILKLREAALTEPADRMLQQLIYETGVLSLRDEDGSGRLRRCLNMLCDMAVSCAGRGGGLHEMITRLRGMMQRSDIKEAGVGQKAVTLISIHRSKGLEFPVCFVSDTNRAFNLRAASEAAVLDSAQGLFMKLPDGAGLVRCDNPQRRAAALGETYRQLEEEMRVLYVALTRAGKRLIITRTVHGAEEAAEKSRARLRYGVCEHSVLAARCLGDWILDAAYSAPNGNLRVIRVNEDTLYDFGEGFRETEAPEEEQISSDLIRERLNFVYPEEYLQNIPAKLSVSELTPTVLDGRVYKSEPMPPAPAFISGGEQKADAAARGTATHMFMQFFDPDRLMRLGVAAEVSRLEHEHFISPRDIELIRQDELEAFRASKLFSRILRAKKLYRELRFNSMLPAWEFTQNAQLARKLREAGTQICVQGVVDCLFIDEYGRSVLADYKTDRLTKAELSDRTMAAAALTERHGGQLEIYRRICCELLAGNVDEICIYSLHLGDTINICHTVDGGDKQC